MEPGPGGFTAAGRALIFCPHPYGAGEMLRAYVPLAFQQAQGLGPGNIII